jgi:hypothetical protein
VRRRLIPEKKSMTSAKAPLSATGNVQKTNIRIEKEKCEREKKNVSDEYLIR